MTRLFGSIFESQSFGFREKYVCKVYLPRN